MRCRFYTLCGEEVDFEEECNGFFAYRFCEGFNRIKESEDLAKKSLDAEAIISQ